MRKQGMKLLGVLAAFVLMLASCGNTSTSTASNANGEVVFYIVRHGKTMLNTTDRVQGWSDAVLTPAGEEVVTHLGKGLADTDFVAAFSSDSGRAIQTAKIVLEENKNDDIELKTDPRFREFNFGSYEGDENEKMWTDIATSQGKTMEEWMSTMTPKNFADSVAKLDKDRVEEGINWPAENYQEITTRLKEGLTDVAEEVSSKGGGNVLLASHGLSINALVDILSEGEVETGKQLGNASVTKVIYKDGVFTVEEVGSMEYVEKGEKM